MGNGLLFPGFRGETDEESPARERPEGGAPQEASSQERPPDERPACFHGAGHQSSGSWEQGPEGTQDDTAREGEVSGPHNPVAYPHHVRAERALKLDACSAYYEVGSQPST